MDLLTLTIMVAMLDVLVIVLVSAVCRTAPAANVQRTSVVRSWLKGGATKRTP